MANFDLSEFALKCACPNNDILYDDKGLPSIMVYIPKFKISEVISGASDSIHPAFRVNGVEIDGFWFSKFQNITKDGRAYSLPGQDPRASITMDAARAACEEKGEGWHLTTRAEWSAVALWCLKNGFQPKGNNNYGKDASETLRKAIPSYKDGNGTILHVATGSGPVTWAHDNTLSGIWDMNGNVTEWMGGLRTVYGEIQVLAYNNAADSDNSQAATSAQWKAIDTTTGEFITPNGSGTTPNSVKVDWLSGHAVLSKTKTTDTGSGSSLYSGCAFSAITADATISEAAKEMLMALCLLPSSATASDYNGDYSYWDNVSAERCFHAGGYYYGGAHAGLFCLGGANPRSYSDVGIGFRAAYVNLPSE